MSRLILKKGNLFSPIDQKIDFRLIDSSEYDLEVTLGSDKRYYQIRYSTSYFDVKEIEVDSFVLPKYSPSGVSPREVDGFRKSSFFRYSFPYCDFFYDELYKSKNSTDSCFAFLQRITGKNNLNNVKTLYCFSIPAIGARKKLGVISYDICIELVRNRYYVVSIKENVEKGYLQRKDIQYMVYDKKEFQKIKAMQENQVLDLAIEKEYPLNLLQYVYLMTNGDEDMIARFFYDLKSACSLDDLSASSLFSICVPNFQRGSELEGEFHRYFEKEQDDINYSYNEKKYAIKYPNS